jgi:Histidine kinase-, DNA gyrase B-, and HSP90-like ATPase
MSEHWLAVRGGGISSAISAQRDYSRARQAIGKFGLMVPEAFVRGIRDLGYRGNGDAIAEFVDNSIQAYADRVDVLFGYDGTASSRKPTQLAIVDNGHGMEPAMMRMAVMWGGTHRENDRVGLGRYGYGLPCAAVSLGRRFSIFSKTASSAMHRVTVDLDALAQGNYNDGSGDIVVPAAVESSIPPFVEEFVKANYSEDWFQGTVILVEKLDRLEWSTTQGLTDNLGRQFGVTYHKLRGQAAIYLDGQFVEPIDPLFLTPGFALFDSDEDQAHGLDPMRIEVRDSNTGAHAGVITLRYSWLPPSFGSIDKSRDAVGLNANARFAILKDCHGLIFSRNGRLVDVQAKTPWTSFINNDRYIKVEIEFSATLDEAFGVTTSKQQVTVSAAIWDELRKAGLPKAIEQLRNKVREAKMARRVAALSPESGQKRLSERTMSDSRQLASTSEFQFDLALKLTPYNLHFEDRSGAPFFRVDRHAAARSLYLNTSHRFFRDIYDAPSATDELRAALEIFLFCFGDVLLSSDNGQADKAEQVRQWSQRLEGALAMMATHLANGDDLDVGRDGV